MNLQFKMIILQKWAKLLEDKTDIWLVAIIKLSLPNHLFTKQAH